MLIHVTAAATAKQDEVTVFVQRIESLKTELEIEQQQGVSLRQKLEAATKVEQEKIKLQKEVSVNFVLYYFDFHTEQQIM